uniref:Uncharacterized protein n=1 Tax=viral metagenome TaxID=1070528 RepID=A0A6C0H5Y6_9ZZZZ
MSIFKFKINSLDLNICSVDNSHKMLLNEVNNIMQFLNNKQHILNIYAIYNSNKYIFNNYMTDLEQKMYHDNYILPILDRKYKFNFLVIEIPNDNFIIARFGKIDNISTDKIYFFNQQPHSFHICNIYPNFIVAILKLKELVATNKH